MATDFSMWISFSIQSAEPALEAISFVAKGSFAVARSCRLRYAGTRLGLKAFFVGGIARFHCARSFIRFCGAQIVVVEIGGCGNKVESNLLSLN